MKFSTVHCVTQYPALQAVTSHSKRAHKPLLIDSSNRELETSVLHANRFHSSVRVLVDHELVSIVTIVIVFIRQLCYGISSRITSFCTLGLDEDLSAQYKFCVYCSLETWWQQLIKTQLRFGSGLKSPHGPDKD